MNDIAALASQQATVVIHVPTSLRRFTDHQDQLEVAANTVGDALLALSQRFPRLRPQLFTPDGSLRRFINIFLNERDIRHLQQSATDLNSGDKITILPAIAGG